MKIYCDKCHKEISKEIDFIMEKNIIGNIKCEHCGALQKRYVSETDLQLYTALSETLYLALTGLAILFYTNLEGKYWLIGIYLIILIGAFFLIKTISRLVYAKAYGKRKHAEYVFKENQEQIKKSMTSQFSIFFIMALGTFIIDELRIELLGGMGIITIASYVKYYICISNEKTYLLEHEEKNNK